MLSLVVLIFFIVSGLNQSTESLIEAKKLRLLKYIGLTDIYLINLDRRPDRLKIMKAQLDLLNLPYIRYPAVDGWKIKEANENQANHDFDLHPETKLNISEKVNTFFKDEALKDKFVEVDIVSTWGEVGCWMSHLQVYFRIRDKARETGVDGPVLILEDDIIMEKFISYEIKRHLKVLPSHWDIFFLGSWGDCIENVNENLCRGYDMWLTSSYVINGSKTAEKLISLSNNGYPSTADGFWRPHFRSSIHAYIFLKDYLANQDRINFGTDIRPAPGHHVNIKFPLTLLIDR